jgi:lipoyl(octanoyl) transferase
VTGDWKNQQLGVGTIAASEVVLSSHTSCASTEGPLLVVELGLISYTDALDLQRRLVAARKAKAIEDVLLLCEHPHAITMGRNGKREHLLASEPVLRQKGVAFYPTDRGGDVTYHGPGQVVGYPILDLAAIRRDVGWYVRMLEETMIRATADYGVAAGREPGKTGVWVANGSAPEKLGAIGVHLSRWVTSHGFAYNVSTDLRYFDLIVPCGLAGRKATSLEKILSRRVDPREAATRLTRCFSEIFGLAIRPASREVLQDRLEQFQQPEPVSA